MVVLVFVSLVSVAGNVIAFRYVYKALDKYDDCRLDPLGEEKWQLQRVARGRHEVVLLGDSLAHNWDYPGTDVLNLGIPSQTSSQVKLRSDSYRDSLSGGRLIVIVGGNDLKSLGTNPDRKNQIVRDCLESVEAIVANHKSRFDEVVLVTVPPAFSPNLGYRMLYGPEIREAHQELNQGIRVLAQREDVRLLDSYAILNAERRGDSLTTDGMHLSPTAYGRLETALKMR